MWTAPHITVDPNNNQISLRVSHRLGVVLFVAVVRSQFVGGSVRGSFGDAGGRGKKKNQNETHAVSLVDKSLCGTLLPHKWKPNGILYTVRMRRVRPVLVSALLGRVVVGTTGVWRDQGDRQRPVLVQLDLSSRSTPWPSGGVDGVAPTYPAAVVRGEVSPDCGGVPCQPTVE